MSETIKEISASEAEISLIVDNILGIGGRSTLWTWNKGLTSLTERVSYSAEFTTGRIPPTSGMVSSRGLVWYSLGLGAQRHRVGRRSWQHCCWSDYQLWSVE